jgi:hypothetical protein
MASFFRRLFDEIIDAFGGGYDKPQPPKPDRPPPTKETEDMTAQQNASPGLPVEGAVCRVCGVMPAKPEYLNEYCDADCVRRELDRELAGRMDAWHDQFQERFGDD